MRNNELLPYDTIVQATSGEPEAVNTVLQYYGRRIRYASRINGPFCGEIPVAADKLTRKPRTSSRKRC